MAIPAAAALLGLAAYGPKIIKGWKSVVDDFQNDESNDVLGARLGDLVNMKNPNDFYKSVGHNMGALNSGDRVGLEKFRKTMADDFLANQKKSNVEELRSNYGIYAREMHDQGLEPSLAHFQMDYGGKIPKNLTVDDLKNNTEIFSTRRGAMPTGMKEELGTGMLSNMPGYDPVQREVDKKRGLIPVAVEEQEALLPGQVEKAAAGATRIENKYSPERKGNIKFAEVMADKQATALEDMFNQARTASEQRFSLESQKAVMAEGLKTGKTQPFMLGVSAFAEDMFGINAEDYNLPDPAKGEMFNQATFDNLLKALQKQKGPQTEGDAERALKTFAGIGNTVDGNIFIIDYLTALADRQEYKADYVFDAVTETYEGDSKAVYRAEKDFRKWSRETPLVAKSPNTGIPVTYSQFKENALTKGAEESQIDELWRNFAKEQ